MRKLFTKKRILFAIVITLVILGFIFSIPFYLKNKYKNSIYIPDTLDSHYKVAIVFGAALDGRKDPSAMLEDRILTAVDLYKEGKIEKIIMSGDNRFVDYNEPEAMIYFANQHGVPLDAMQPDYAGRRTYDTCVRAKEIFSVDEAVLITQNYHLTRAIYLCEEAGIKSIGVSASRQDYSGIEAMRVREYLALILAVADVKFRKPPVVMGDKIEL